MVREGSLKRDFGKKTWKRGVWASRPSMEDIAYAETESSATQWCRWSWDGPRGAWRERRGQWHRAWEAVKRALERGMGRHWKVLFRQWHDPIYVLQRSLWLWCELMGRGTRRKTRLGAFTVVQERDDGWPGDGEKQIHPRYSLGLIMNGLWVVKEKAAGMAFWPLYSYQNG